MKKKTLILCLTSLFTLGAAGGVAIAFGNHLGNDLKVTADDTYSITITPQDLDNDAQEETDMIFNDANVTVKTDQNKNNVSLHYDQSRTYKFNDYYYFDMKTASDAVLYNTSEIRSMLSIEIHGTGTFKCEWGWDETAGVIDYGGSESYYVSTSSHIFDFEDECPNYFKLYPTDGGRRQLDSIIITLKKECVRGTNPYKVVDGISYVKKTDHYGVAGFSGTSVANVTLKTIIDGLPVTEIRANAFYGDTTIESINLDNITVVGFESFKNCTKLVDVGSLENAVHIGYGAFNNDPIEGDMVFGEDLEWIEDLAFYGAKVTSVTFDDACSNPYIEDSAFRSNSELETVHIGSLCGSNFYLDFYAMAKLETITIGAGNTRFSMYKGGLIKDNTLVFILNTSASAGEWVLPNGVTYLYDYFADGNDYITKFVFHDNIDFIGNYGLKQCSALEEVVIGGKVNIIGYSMFRYCAALTTVTFNADIADDLTIRSQAFDHCTSLASLTLPNRLYYIGEAFGDCSSLTDFHYNGTMSQWNAVQKASGWNTGLAATEVVCTDGSVPLS